MYDGYLSGAAYGVNRFLPYAVEQFFINGGSRAYIMRSVPADAKAGSVTTGVLKITAANPASRAKTQVSMAVSRIELIHNGCY